MKKGRKRKRMDDRGLSLVEILVAVVVLVVVLVPTLRLFSSSMTFNSKSRQHQRAITVAESVMEGFKAYDLDSLCRQFGGAPLGEALPFKAVPDVGSYSMVAKNASGVGVEAFVDGKLNPDTTSYEFRLNDTKQEDGFYDVTVDVTKRAANTKKVLDVDCRDTVHDCVVEIPESAFSEVYTMIYDKAKKKLEDDVTAPADMVPGQSLMFVSNSLEITSLGRTINIKSATSGAGDSVKYEIVYTYSAKFKYQYVSATAGLTTLTYPATGEYSDTFKHDFAHSSGPHTAVEEKDAFSGAQNDLTNVYLYYFPLYKGKEPLKAAATSDTINFTGSYSGNVKKIYVVKQKSTILSVANLTNGETNYTGTKVNGPGGAVLVHNFDKNLGGGSTAGDMTPTGFSDKKLISYDAASEDSNALIGDNGLMYDVAITVTKAGSSDQVASFSGTMND